MEVKEPVTEDYRDDRLLLEELVAEMRRLHKRLDEYEPHARRLLDNPITRMLRGRGYDQGFVAGYKWADKPPEKT